MKLALVYFSATSNTRKMAEVIGGEFQNKGVEVDSFDITSLSDRTNDIDFSPYDAVVFGFPVHSLRAPRVVREWLMGIDGQGKKCAMFFTFGGFLVHPAHHSTQTMLTDRGFVVVSSAEFPGAHTFNLSGWSAFTGRPDGREADLAKRYVAATLDRFKGTDQGVLGPMEQGPFSEEELDRFETYRFMVITQVPHRDGRQCSLCGLCEESCPTGAMSAEAGCADPKKCIACLRCVDICPEQALEVNDARGSWEQKLAMGQTTETEVNKQTGTIYL